MSDNRRDFLKKAALLAGGTGLWSSLPASIQHAISIDPALGSTFYDAEHVVMLMQENRSFDHAYGMLQGVRGFNDPRAISLPNKNLVWLQSDGEGNTYPPMRLNIKDSRATWMGDLPHSWENQLDARNHGKYDKWIDVKRSGREENKGIPLTMGYHTREDIPFYYALADAFTVCDQHFCSSLTGTTPNRMYFWSGTVRGKSGAQPNVRNSETGYEKEVDWKTFPERLEESGISWRVYQNELSLQTELEGEDEALLSNFTNNNLEWFAQYKIRFAKEHCDYIRTQTTRLEQEITRLQLRLQQPNGADHLINEEIAAKEQELAAARKQLEEYSPENFSKLSAFQQNIHKKAFTNNSGDPYYHQTETLEYTDPDGNTRSVKVPKGDVLHQFREDVENNRLPTVTWLVAPHRFSDHPSSPWYGAWYVSEVLEILTRNPEVWKKTIFILNYDENDGYFDHQPPFVAPDPLDSSTGRISEGLDATDEFVRLEEELKKPGMKADRARQGPIGLGYRVPLVIASPWTRGGWVNSEVCDISSTLLFLEKFLSRKTGKAIKETNISSWRRAICGDLSSVFRPYHGEQIELPRFLDRNKVMKDIHQSQYQGIPAYAALSPAAIAAANADPVRSGYLPRQEPGTRKANALPYELYVDGALDADRQRFSIRFAAGNTVFGERSAGAPFHVYAPGRFRNGPEGAFEAASVRSYAVAAAADLSDTWPVAQFEDERYHLRVYGPNGFFREFTGDRQDPPLGITARYHRTRRGAYTGNLEIVLTNSGSRPYRVEIKDNSYKTIRGVKELNARPGRETSLVVALDKSFGWYDLTITVPGAEGFMQRIAGKTETGREGITDPLMGGMV